MTRLPDSSSSALTLELPTPTEQRKVWNLTASTWADALTPAQYLSESNYLLEVPLAADGGMTNWILTDSMSLPDERAILASCETFRKRVFVKRENGVRESIVHGVASVFCPPEYRGRGYGQRMLRELAERLQTWQCDQHTECVGSILYSDIGKRYYSSLGWLAESKNVHINFTPQNSSDLTVSRSTIPITSANLATLCALDEILMRERMSRSFYPCFAVVPDVAHMQWHHAKEEFACNTLFGNSKIPINKGAMIGEVGERVWMIWTRRYYAAPPDPDGMNMLYILRLAFEDQEVLDEKVEVMDGRKKELRVQLKALLSMAWLECIEWGLKRIQIWNPEPQVLELLKELGLPFEIENREDESVASLLWYGNENSMVMNDTRPQWIANEKYSWC